MKNSVTPQATPPRSGGKRRLEEAEDSASAPKKVPRNSVKLPSPPPLQQVVFEKDGKQLILDHSKSTDFHQHYQFEIACLEDLVFLSDYYPKIDKSKTNNLSFYTIRRIAPSIQKLLNLVGLKHVKQQLFEMIVYHLQRFERKNHDMLHSVIYGGPGVGKTKFIGILGEIYAHLGVLEHGRVRFVKRSDLVGKYLGHTAAKTRQVIEDSRGGVLVIDEAYSLGDTEGRDSFSRECIDTLNQALSEEKQNFVCIIAGYKEDLEQRFFRSNAGLERRFPFRYSIPDYSPAELREIFLNIVLENHWAMDANDLSTTPFEENKDYFTFNGGDMEVIFTKAKFAHSVRVFSLCETDKKKLSRADFDAGLKAFLKMDNVQKRRQVNEMISWMYL
jgi:hypothetical protein